MKSEEIKAEQIVFVQNYFAVQTRRAEIIEQRILDYGRVVELLAA